MQTKSSVSEVWVTYKTHHPTGFFYLGKSSERRIKQGYQGSGPRFKCALHVPGYEPNTWTTTVLSKHTLEGDAYAAESRLVTLAVLADPFCLNTTIGGQTRCYGSPYMKYLKTFKKPRVVKKKQKTIKKIVLAKDGTVTIQEAIK